MGSRDWIGSRGRSARSMVLWLGGGSQADVNSRGEGDRIEVGFGVSARRTYGADEADKELS